MGHTLGFKFWVPIGCHTAWWFVLHDGLSETLYYFNSIFPGISNATLSPLWPQAGVMGTLLSVMLSVLSSCGKGAIKQKMVI